MKVRQAFVANSSSSSFICDLCGDTFNGWDACPSDFDHSDCVNDHTICNDGIVGEPVRDNSYDEIPAENCPFCLMLNFTQADMKRFLQAKYKVDPSVVFAEVKEANRRRRKLYDSEYVSYVYRIHETSSTVEEKFIKDSFKNYDEWMKWIREENKK